MKNYSTQPKQSALSKTLQKRSAQAIPVPQQEEIARRAYEIFLKRGSQPGNPEKDWLQAECELRAQAMDSSDAVRSNAQPPATIGVAHTDKTSSPITRDCEAATRNTIPMSPGPRNAVK